MNSRIHRTGPNTVDVDFIMTPTLIITTVCNSHQQAVELKRLWDELPSDEHRKEEARRMVREYL